jgi:hypothetical protein
MSKAGILSITCRPHYGLPRDMPIKIIKEIPWKSCRTWQDLQKKLNQTSYMWNKKHRRLCNKKLGNKNVMITGFCSFWDTKKKEELCNNFPTFEDAENVFFVENNDDFVIDLVKDHKCFPDSANVYIIDTGIGNGIKFYPSVAIKCKINELQKPLYTQRDIDNMNRGHFVTTESIIDTINEGYYEENALYKE